MTLGFAKIVANGLRLGDYEGKWEAVWDHSVNIKDVNADICACLTIEKTSKTECKRKLFKKDTITTNGFRICISTGIISAERHLTYKEYFVWEDASDYKEWDEFSTWVQFQWQDKVYKHELAVEEALL